MLLCDKYSSTAILMIEGNEICGYEAIKIVQNLQTKLEGCIEQNYMSIEAEMELTSLSEQGQEFDPETVFNDIMRPIYGKQLIT